MSGFRRTLVGLGAVASAAALALTPAAAGAAGGGWQVVFTRHYGPPANQSLYEAVAATGTNDAWAFGTTNWSNPHTGVPVAEHWTGGAWRDSPLPPGMTSAITAASADSASDVWAVTQFGGDILHWTGSTWSVAKSLAGPDDLTGVIALSPSDVWVFGGYEYATGFGTWHFDGQAWTQQTGWAAGILWASAASPADIWAVTSNPRDRGGIVHYNGTAWQRVTSPALTGLGVFHILAESANSVWATATSRSGAWHLLHFSNGRWAQVALPLPHAGLQDLAPDGRGGIWLGAYDRHGSFLWHRSAAGHWSRIAATPGTMTLIPGTTTALGAAAQQAATGWNAAVWANGPLG